MIRTYADAGCTDRLSDAVITRGEILSWANPDKLTVSSPVGADEDRPLFLRNDDPGKIYVENVITCNGGDSNAFYLYAPDVAGAPGEFVASMALPDFSDAATVVKIWRRLHVEPGLPTQKRRTITHRITTTEGI